MKEKIEKIDIEISDEVFIKLAKQAHEKDITFNQHCINLLKEFIENNK